METEPCTAPDEWLNKTWYPHGGVLLDKKKARSSDTCYRVDALEKPSAQKARDKRVTRAALSIYKKYPEKANAEAESRLVIVRAGRRGGRIANEHRLCFLGEGDILL